MSYSYKPLDEYYLEKIKKWFPNVIYSYEFNPGEYVMPKAYKDLIQDILDFEVMKDDVWVLSYPRTGSGWCQTIVWLLMNDLNFDLASSTTQFERSPNIELGACINAKWEVDHINLEYVKNLPSPRCLKAHTTYALMPKQLKTVKPKIIYNARNPKDTWCSWYHLLCTLYSMEAPFDEASELFCKGKMPFGDFFENVLPFWERRNEPNILFVKYEDRLKDTKKAIREIADFLEKPLTEEELDKVNDFVSFDNMKNNEGLNLDEIYNRLVSGEDDKSHFIRKGKCGDWKNHMSEEISEMFDEWIERKSGGTGLIFDYE